MLTTGVQIHLLDDRIDHLDGIVFMRDKPLDGALAHHQTFANPMAYGWRGFLLLTPTDGPVPFLGERSTLASFFLFKETLGTTSGIDTAAYPCYLCAIADFLINPLYLPISISRKSDGMS